MTTKEQADKENLAKLYAFRDEAQKSGDGERMAVLKMMCAIGLIKGSKLPSDQLADFSSAAITAFRSAILLSFITSIMENNDTTKVPVELLLGLHGLKLCDQDEKNQKRLATLTALFDGEHKAAAEGQANG